MTSDQVMELRKLLVQDAQMRAREMKAVGDVIDVLKKQMEEMQNDILGLARLVGKLQVEHKLSTDLSTGIGQKREQSGQNEDST